jgi:hypothetical protein
MWKISRIFAPITIQKHDVISALQLGKDALSPSAENANAFGEASLLESLVGEVRMIPVSFNSVHPTVGA